MAKSSKSYSNFTPDDISALGLQMLRGKVIDTTLKVEPSQLLLMNLEAASDLPLSTEKAKSEFIISPVLNDVRLRNRDKMTFFSGYSLNIDSKKGLKGRCDFIFSKGAMSVSIQSPIFCAIEAKNDTPDDEDNFAQCTAEMYAAKLMNEKRGNDIKVIYGAVTNGYEWIFLKLEDNISYVDIGNRYAVQQLPELLGALQTIIDTV